MVINIEQKKFQKRSIGVKSQKKNQSLKLKILEINQEKEKIRLGVKQLAEDPFEFFTNKKVSDVITAIVSSSNNSGIFVNVGNKGPAILIKKNQLAKDIENQRETRFTPGQKVDVLIQKLDKKKREVQLSIKALEEKESKEALKKYGSEDSGMKLRDILGPLISKKKKKDN